MKSSLPIIVRSTEIEVNGHVNNAKYLEYFEWGREEWYEQCALPYETFFLFTWAKQQPAGRLDPRPNH